MARIGLCVDVGTFRGTCESVPRLLEILSKHNIQTNIFFGVDPDDMGRHPRRLMKSQSLWKMLCSNVASLYGRDILLAGMVWPGREVSYTNVDIIRKATRHHEVGPHARGYHAWQAHSGNWDR